MLEGDENLANDVIIFLDDRIADQAVVYQNPASNTVTKRQFQALFLTDSKVLTLKPMGMNIDRIRGWGNDVKKNDPAFFTNNGLWGGTQYWVKDTESPDDKDTIPYSLFDFRWLFATEADAKNYFFETLDFRTEVTPNFEPSRLTPDPSVAAHGTDCFTCKLDYPLPPQLRGLVRLESFSVHFRVGRCVVKLFLTVKNWETKWVTDFMAEAYKCVHQDMEALEGQPIQKPNDPEAERVSNLVLCGHCHHLTGPPMEKFGRGLKSKQCGMCNEPRCVKCARAPCLS
eukprot:TRINITY_DN61707_c0_g1_i1.p1 TRINITY_DN61707_c0_g1~~TRINITY_DN61707_c0_g1_i1.p1  ORF type:complete len:285 (+),score=28.82 TRINITY_DN61707_c0_g1_i1:318-1172(+)